MHFIIQTLKRKMILYISLRKWVSFSSVTFISGKHLHKSISKAYHLKASSSSKKNNKNGFSNEILKSPFISFNNIFPWNMFYHITFFMLQYINLSLTSIFRSYVQMNLLHGYWKCLNYFVNIGRKMLH